MSCDGVVERVLFDFSKDPNLVPAFSSMFCTGTPGLDL